MAYNLFQLAYIVNAERGARNEYKNISSAYSNNSFGVMRLFTGEDGEKCSKRNGRHVQRAGLVMHGRGASKEIRK